MYIIVGLGNPTEQYAHTHHNAGFDAVDAFAASVGAQFTKQRCKALVAEAHIGGERVILAKPQTYMNLSGESVSELVHWYKIPMDHLAVVYDDIDLPMGHVRFRKEGGSGTHNGMRSIISLLGREDFPRVRIGVGAAPQGWDLVDWVLAGWRTPEEKQAAQRAFEDACAILRALIAGGAEEAARASNALAQKYKPPKPQRANAAKYDFSPVAEAIKARIDARYVSGAVCAVSVDGKMAYQTVQGLADVEAGTKMTRDTVFRLASMTKPLTAAAVMILSDRGLLSIDDPVDKYLPFLAPFRVIVRDDDGHITGTEPARRCVTIRDLLTHSSGLGQETPLWDEAAQALPEEEWTLSGIVSGTRTVPLDFQPGTKTGYSAIAGMNVLARIVEVVSGMGFYAFLSTEILNPLGMGDTTYAVNDHQWRRMAKTYVPTTLEEMPMGRAGFGGMKRVYECGGAGLVGTMSDYLRFTLMLLGGGEYRGARILSEDAVRAMSTPQIGLPSSPYETWGLGMRVIRSEGEGQPLPAGAYGWSGAYGTHFWIDPERKLTCVLMASGDVGGAGSPLSREVEAAVMQAMRTVRS